MEILLHLWILESLNWFNKLVSICIIQTCRRLTCVLSMKEERSQDSIFLVTGFFSFTEIDTYTCVWWRKSIWIIAFCFPVVKSKGNLPLWSVPAKGAVAHLWWQSRTILFGKCLAQNEKKCIRDWISELLIKGKEKKKLFGIIENLIRTCTKWIVRQDSAIICS